MDAKSLASSARTGRFGPGCAAIGFLTSASSGEASTPRLPFRRSYLVHPEPVHALLEREVRRAMARRGIAELTLYPEDRDCKAPSTDRILETFAPLQRHLLYKAGRVVQRFDPELTDLQRRLLGLLGISPKAFMNV